MMTSELHSILLVEDDPDMRLLLQLTLRSDPRLDVAAEAASAEDAIRLVDEVEPEVILLDHGLDGDVLGLHAAPILKAHAPDAKVILFSALDLRNEARAEPAVDYFLRKDRIRDLLGTIQSLLGLGAAEDSVS